MTPPVDPLVEDLRLLRMASGLAVHAFARRCELPVATVDDWLSGKYEPRLSALRRAFRAHGYGIKVYAATALQPNR